jgi:predicted alpha/beta-hydrolase family hydrolase
MTVSVDESRTSGLWLLPSRATACFVFAHGAGAGMEHPFMATVANELCDRDIATLRYQFPYMERGSRRPDPPALCHATVRAAIAQASRLAPDLPMFAGGKSFGGRMTSQAQAASALGGVLGLVFFGFPLHPAGRPSVQRGDHLHEVKIPMLFLQGTRDELASPDLLGPLVDSLGERATLATLKDADHSFHVPARTGRKDPDVRKEALDTMGAWVSRISAS